MSGPLRILAALALAGGLSACASTSDVPTRAAPLTPPSAGVPLQTYTPVSYKVTVPYDLRVSEANTYIPNADIVWRGDPLGDRHAQVAALFETAMQRQPNLPKGQRPAHVDVKVLRFHGVTERTYYTIGGWHSMTFELTMRDPDTGAVLEPPRTVTTSIKSYGGARAVAMERNGLTQKVRVTNHLTYAINEELTGSGAGQKVRDDFETAITQL